MKLQERMLSIAVFLALIMFLSLAYFELSMTKEVVETNLRTMVEQKKHTFEKMLEISLKGLESYCRDWAIWDDTYEFVSNRNQGYIKSNLEFNTFLVADINLMVFLDKNGSIVFSRFYDSEWNERDIPPVFLSRALLGKSGYSYSMDRLCFLLLNRSGRLMEAENRMDIF